MYTIQESVRVVIALLKQYNIRQIVLNPGGTNIPIVQAVQNDPFFVCYSVPDERSAIYFAIGLHLQTGEIIATSCTSAQATRNYLPGLTEAFYKHVPILAITTSKLERYQYQDYMQAPDQTSLPKDAVRCSFDIPPITDINTRMLCEQNVRNAILSLTHHGYAPVQLNLRIVDSEQGRFDDFILPKIRKISRYMAWDEWNIPELDNKKILVVVGEHLPFNTDTQNVFENFCASYNVAVYCNHCSNYYGKYSFNGNLMATVGKIPLPDIVITIGGQTGDYSIFGFLNGHAGLEHWRVSEDGNVVDTYSCLTKIFECPDYYFFEKLSLGKEISHPYYDSIVSAYKELKFDDMELPLSNLFVAQQYHNLIPKNSIMNFAILNSLRCWSFFPLDSSIKCFANIAAFGIDGCNSMLIGESVCVDEKCFIVTGDLAFFYDMNALGIRHIKNNLRVLLINNNGGAEFKYMTRGWDKKIKTEDYISACGHNSNAKGWCESCGFKYLNAKSIADFNRVKDCFLEDSSVPILFEVFTDANKETEALNIFLNSNQSPSGKFKKIARDFLGDKGLSFVHSLRRK